MSNLIVYFAPNNHRSELVAKAMVAGIQKCGHRVDLKPSTAYRGIPEYDAAIFYGFGGGLRRVFEHYRQRSRAIYIDLGYWGRRKRTRWDGYHKLILNSRHPNAYFQNRRHPSDRFREFRLSVEPWRQDGRYIILAGMSAKAAAAEGFRAEEWERAAVRTLRQFTDREIIYRPKPNWPDARLIPGTRMDCQTPLDRAFKRCHAVVTHHSNVGIDALLAGVPVFTVEGAAAAMGCTDFSQIESPVRPAGRAQWAADLAYCQYSMQEMTDGVAYRYLLDEGLILP